MKKRPGKEFLNCVKGSNYIVLTENNQCYWKSDALDVQELTNIFDSENVKYVVAGIYKTNVNNGCEYEKGKRIRH